MKRISILLLFTLLAACRNEEEPVYRSTEGCPYQGAIAELAYPTAVPYEAVTDIWRANNWQTANPDARKGTSLTGFIEGAFEQSGWVVTEVAAADNRTTIRVWVNQESDEAKHKQQMRKAVKLLDVMRIPIEEAYGISGTRQEKMNLGCIED
ncbi:hypothetical protein [Cohnella boryungensis]|uniref:DUF3574 domain-containing protein n=1 Tax=Cohnella boryungensis TaxID=768479 RepID=A0ABV8SIC0_9BACL